MRMYRYSKGERRNIRTSGLNIRLISSNSDDHDLKRGPKSCVTTNTTKQLTLGIVFFS